MARAAARSGPSTRMLENGRIEFEFLTDDFFFISDGDCCGGDAEFQLPMNTEGREYRNHQGK